MVDIFRKQLDQLMGSNRNGNKTLKLVKHFWDDKVCKYDLLNLCPYKLFPNTKQDLGPCPFEICPVPQTFKDEYAEKRKNGEDVGYPKYEYELMKLLEKLIIDIDSKINSSKKRLEIQKLGRVANEPKELTDVKKKMEDVSAKIEVLGEEGNIDEAQQMMEELDNLKKQKELIESKMPAIKEQSLVVCETCGALLSENESDQRLADHFAGKMHLGFQKIRSKFDELKQELDNYKSSSSSNYSKENDKSGSPQPIYKKSSPSHGGSSRHGRDRDDRDYSHSRSSRSSHRYSGDHGSSSSHRDHRDYRDHRDHSSRYHPYE